MQRIHGRNSSKLLSYIIAGMMILLPFHAIITVWLSQHMGDYEVLRFWKDLVLVVAIVPVIIIALRNNLISRQLLRSRLMWLIAAYIVLQIAYAAAALLWSERSIESIARSLTFNVGFLVFFLLCAFASNRTDWLRLYWRSTILLPALLVMGFGVFQVLGNGTQVLESVGYANTPATMPVLLEGTDVQRMQSGQQNPEVLGGYLLLIVTTLVVLIATRNHIRFWRIAMLVLAALCIVLVFSQSIWLGALLSIGVGAFLCTKTKKQRIITGIVYSLGLLGLIGAAFLFKDSVIVQEVIGRPLFEGWGSAPLLGSVEAVMSGEMPYVEYILHRSGVFGLLLMICIILALARGWWIERSATLNRVMLASLLGMIIVALTGITWADSTVAYLWWGLAGIAYGSQIARQQEREQRSEAFELHKDSKKT